MNEELNGLNSKPNSFTIPAGPLCEAMRQAWQRRQDGERIEDTPELASHRRDCAACLAFEATADCFERALARTPAATPPVDLAPRVLSALKVEAVRQPSRAFRYALAGFALAASVVLIVLAVQDRHPDSTTKPKIVKQVPTRPILDGDTLAAPLATRLEEAESAVSSLTKKSAPEGLSFRIPKLSLSSSSSFDRLQPAVDSIQSVGHGAVSSVVPLADSAKSAADLLWRELSIDSREKTKVN